MKRMDVLRDLMTKKGFKNALLTDTNDIFYYTGYRTMDIAFLLVNMDSANLFVFELDNEAAGLKNFDVKFIKKLKDLKNLGKYKRLAYDSLSMNSRVYRRLKSFGIGLKDETDMLREPRMVKDSSEIEKISKAVKITKNILKNLKITGTEKDVSKNIDIDIRKNNCSNAFDNIVSAGKNGYFIHHRPSVKRITGKDLVIVDCGAKLDGYCADITRTYCKTPGKKEMDVIENVGSIQRALIDSVKAGIEVKDIQNLYENLMKKSGYRVMHSFGHGVGLYVHESLGKILEKNMVITIEPGIYIKNFGGCRIEDTIVVQKDRAKVL